MTNEEREAIKILKEIQESNRAWLMQTKEENCEKIYLKDIEAIDAVLSLIKEQQEKIAKYEKIYKEYDCYRWVKELDKKDKQIDLMTEIFYKRFKAELLLEYGFENEEQLKQYFAELVEKEKIEYADTKRDII